jgi:hypothetical protein
MILNLKTILTYQTLLMNRCSNEWERQKLTGKVEMLQEVIKLMEQEGG